MIDLFKPRVSHKNLNKNFKKVMKGKHHSAAREKLNRVFNSLPSIDTHFVKDFQTLGFDARIWEIYLSAVFSEQGFKSNRTYERPDFLIEKSNTKISVEASTSNKSDDDQYVDKTQILKNIGDDQEEFQKYMYQLRNESTIKLANTLLKKLKKKYWELDWVSGNPLIIALEPFHHPLVHMLSDSNLIGYLYGFEQSWKYDENGLLKIDSFKVTEHKSKNKTVKSNFFNLPETQYISAVIFSNSGTISKFNRMGKLDGLGNKEVRMIRNGTYHNHDNNASFPLPFVYEVGENGPLETWAQGLTMYHNPNALHFVDRNLFPDMLHGYWEESGFFAYVPNFHPYMSETAVIYS